MTHIRRIERGVSYHVRVKAGLLSGFVGGAKRLSAQLTQQVAAVLHDRMTEAVLGSANDAAGLFRELDAKPLAFVDVMAKGKDALLQANSELGLALSDDEIDYLLNAFTPSQAQSDRCRIDDVCASQ